MWLIRRNSKEPAERNAVEMIESNGNHRSPLSERQMTGRHSEAVRVLSNATAWLIGTAVTGIASHVSGNVATRRGQSSVKHRPSVERRSRSLGVIDSCPTGKTARRFLPRKLRVAYHNA